jgi:cytochrome c biogenesis protein CcmG/thiol:disulfide interchange protein DsbE
MSENLSVIGDTTAASPAHEQPRAANQRAALFWRVSIVGVFALFVAFLAIGLRREWVSEQRATGMAPEFEFTTFAGETIRLADLRGKGVVLNFWASWCLPCRDEAPLLEQAWRRERDRGIVFIGLDYLDQEHAAKAFLDEFDITYPTGPDLQSAAARRYRITGVPETFFIGPDGQIVSQVIGPILSLESLNQKLDAIRPPQ